MKHIAIGSIEVDYGIDVYSLAIIEEAEDTGSARHNERDVSAAFSAIALYDTHQAGARFCSRVTVQPLRHSDGTRFICIAHVRYDV